METMKTTKPAATKENIDQAIDGIKKYAADKGYQFLVHPKKAGLLSGLLGGGKPKFESKSKEKVCQNYMARLERKPGMSSANRFLHFLHANGVMEFETLPKIDYSEQELKIRTARKLWRKSLEETEKLRLAYRETKGTFFKK